MYVRRVSLTSFRNYGSGAFEFAPGLNIVAGANARGKTNLLEAVYYLAAARSFRARRDAELVQYGESRAVCEAVMDDGERDITLRAELSDKSRRSFYINGVKERTAAGFAGRLKAVLFVPGDLALVDDGAAERRQFMDEIFMQLRPRYAAAAERYRRLFDRKTRILRDFNEGDAMHRALDAYDEQMAVVGAALVSYRFKFCTKLCELAAAAHGTMTGGGEEMSARYVTEDGAATDMSESDIAAVLRLTLAAHRSAEVAARRALVGPHRDDIEICIDGRAARTYASQGQKRTAALAFKLAARELIRLVSGELPVLLLDDVLSELDERRRDRLLSDTSDGQTILTLCDRSTAGGYGGNWIQI